MFRPHFQGSQMTNKKDDMGLIKLDILIKEIDDLKKTDPMGTSQKAAVLRANLQSAYGANMFNLKIKLEKNRLNLSSDDTKKRAV